MYTLLLFNFKVVAIIMQCVRQIDCMFERKFKFSTRKSFGILFSDSFVTVSLDLSVTLCQVSQDLLLWDLEICFLFPEEASSLSLKGLQYSAVAGGIAADTRGKEGRAEKLQCVSGEGGRRVLGQVYNILSSAQTECMSTHHHTADGCARSFFRFIYKLRSYLSSGTIDVQK